MTITDLSRKIPLLWALTLILLSTSDAHAAENKAASAATVQNRLAVTKCGYDEQAAQYMAKTLGPGFGYGYDSLLVDLDRWAASPYVKVDSFGVTNDSLVLWDLTITEPDTGVISKGRQQPKIGIHIHARTHPIEVQGWWVTNEIINILVSEDPYARMLRENIIFYIVPMYNPDGVERGWFRENANGVDIESNWAVDLVEVEVAALRRRFTQLMASEVPLEVALNMHSDYQCNRFFVFHDSTGTSPSYYYLEQTFIEGIRTYFPGGIKPWDHMITWYGSTRAVYPEGWFWLNHGETVLALTYEDMHCAAAGLYDSTAYAVLHGIGDFLGLEAPVFVSRNRPLPFGYRLEQNYPNPFNSGTAMEFEIPLRTHVSLAVYDIMGREVVRLTDEEMGPGIYQVAWDGKLGSGREIPSGIYIARLRTFAHTRSVKMLLLK